MFVSDAPVILKPQEPVAERVLLPGDPGRALRLAQQLIDGPRMLNHHRGLWGYSGPGPGGAPLTIQSTGLGGPSAAAVVAELVALGARRMVRVGTAAGLGATRLGALVVAESAIAADGASRALARRDMAGADHGAAAPVAPGDAPRIAADAALTAALAAAVGADDGARGLVASADIHDPVLAAGWARAGALACDLTTAAVLAAAAHHGARAASVLAITRAGGERIADDALERLEAGLGAAGAAALS
jgi:uridine phosphorylase